MQKKIIIIFLLLTLCFTSCSNSEEAGKKQDIDNITHNVPDHYQAEISDKLNVDASVSVPQAKEFSVLSVTKKCFDKEKVANILFQGKVFEQGELIYQTSDGDKLYISSIEKGSFQYVTKFATQVFHVFDYGDLNTGNREKFQEKELEGFSKDKAISKAEELLAKLGISSFHLSEVIALDGQTMQQEQDILLEDDYIQTLVNEGRMELKEEWGTEDACYYLVFSMHMRDIPVTQHYFTMQTIDDTLYGSSIHMLVSQNKVEGFEIHYYLYEEVGVKTEVEQLFTMEHAIEKANEKYGQLLLNDKYNITEVELAYVPLKDGKSNDMYVMTPAWTMVVEIHSKGLSKDETGNLVSVDSVHNKLFLVNAVTGEEII